MELYAGISLVCFLLGSLAGFVMHRSDYCIAGMFRNLFLFRHTVMIRSLVLLIVVSMILFELARQAGLLPLLPFPLLYSPTPANLLGGFLFGTGMVLAGGCAVGNLYKMGAGNFPSMLACGGFIAGSALYAEMHPLWALFIKNTTFFPGKITIPQILGVDPSLVIFPAAAFGMFFLFTWHKKKLLQRPSYAEGYLQPWKAAICLSLISLSSYVLVGMPLGVTSAYAKTAGYLESFLFRGHVAGLPFFRAVSLNYIHPLTGLRLQGGAGPRFDAFSLIQYPLAAGIILGSCFSAIMLREFRIYFRAPFRQHASAFSGGIIMGLASRMAPTCNVWHLMGGLPILAASSLLFTAGLLPGAWAGSRLLVTLATRDYRQKEGGTAV